MNTMRGTNKTQAGIGFEHAMNVALAEFEADSRLACRALRVKMAIGHFGVGSVLPNDLPRQLPPESLPDSMISHTLQ